MRYFTCYLFENFDPETHAQNPQNPRNLLNASVDPVLSHIAQFPAGKCAVSDLSSKEIIPLLYNDILREENGYLFFNTPVFLKEDASVLQQFMDKQGSYLADRLAEVLPELRKICAGLNGFSPEENLYHLLCGMVFDGLFFDCLSSRGVIATSHIHPSGLDYLSVIYERCPELDTFSDRLLCSYNRFTDGHCALQSFGDSNGNRFDFYRVSRQMESGIPVLSQPLPDKHWLLSQVRTLALHGICHRDAMRLLEQFGYAKNGTFCVPVYGPDTAKITKKMTAVVDEAIGDAFASVLSSAPEITAVHHGVAPGEIANELYHILFGFVSESLCSAGLVASPPHISGEGRYLRCIELDI